MSELSILDNNYLCVRCSFEEKDKVKFTGGMFDRASKTWLMPCTDFNVKYLINNLNDVQFGENFDEKFNKQLAREERLNKIAKMAQVDAPVKFKVPGIKITDKFDLYNYQKLGVLYALTTTNGVLLADMCGLGKTLQAIAVACYKKYKEGITNCLIVTPASLKWNWPLEIERFTDEKYVVIDGSPEERLRQWRRDVFFYVVNYETLIEDWFGGKNLKIKSGEENTPKGKKKKQQMERAAMRAEKLAGLRERVWDIMVVDEIHALKSHESRRSECCKSIQAYFKMGLTGTPIDGKLEELHSIYEFILPGLFECKTAFLQHHANFDFMGKITSYKEIGRCRDRIKPFFLRRRKEEVLKDLPPKIYQNRFVLLSDKEREVYDQLADHEHEITESAQAMEKVLRCKQFCDHPELIGLDMKQHSKMDMFEEILDELVVQNNARVIVFSQYAKMCHLLIENVIKPMKLKYLYIWGETDKKLRADYQAMFNTDKSIDLIIGTDAMSTGLNLYGSSYVINYDDFWSPSIMEQREDRSHRIGQKSTVNVINFIVKDTIEERVREVLYSKSKVSADVLGDTTEETVLKRLGPTDIAKLL